MKRMEGLIGLVLAIGLSVSLVIAIFGLAYWDRPLADPGAEIMSTAVGGMVTALGVVAGYLARGSS